VWFPLWICQVATAHSEGQHRATSVIMPDARSDGAERGRLRWPGRYRRGQNRHPEPRLRGWQVGRAAARAATKTTVTVPTRRSLSAERQRPPSTVADRVHIEGRGTPTSAHSGSPSVAVLVAVRHRLSLFAGVHTIDLTCAVTAREPRRTQPDQAFNPWVQGSSACARTARSA
jgi:hypothetical protein